jgi:hypothetical protein
MKEEIQVFINGSFVTYLDVEDNITEENIVKKASEHLPKGIFRIKATFSPHRFLNLITVKNDATI